MSKTFPRPYLNSEPISLAVRSKVLPRKDAIYIVPRPLQKLGDDFPLCPLKANDKDCKQSEFSQFKSQDKFKRESKEGGQSSNIPTDPKCYGSQRYGHMK